MPSQRRVRRDLLDQHIARLQRAVSCVSRAVVLTDGYRVRLSAAPAPLGGPPPAWTFILQQELEDTPTEALRTVRYTYRIAEAYNDRELVAYHRHSGRHDYDHIHTPLGSVPEVAMPTGEVDAAQVIRFCITELGVIPLRPDWSSVLAYASAAG